MPRESLAIRITAKVGSFNHLVSALQEQKYEVDMHQRNPVLRMSAGFLRHDKVEYKADQILESYIVGDHVQSPVFGRGVVLKTFGNGQDISLQVQFGEQMKLILPRYGKLQKVSR